MVAISKRDKDTYTIRVPTQAKLGSNKGTKNTYHSKWKLIHTNAYMKRWDKRVTGNSLDLLLDGLDSEEYDIPVLLLERRAFCPRSVHILAAVTASLIEAIEWGLSPQGDLQSSSPVAFCLRSEAFFTPKLKPRQRLTSTFKDMRN